MLVKPWEPVCAKRRSFGKQCWCCATIRAGGFRRTIRAASRKITLQVPLTSVDTEMCFVVFFPLAPFTVCSGTEGIAAISSIFDRQS